MAALIDTAKKGRKADAHRPWPRAIVTSDAWRLVVQQLVEARATMIGLWGDAGAVHLALIEEPSGEIGGVSPRMPRRQIPLGRRASSPGDQARARDARSLRAETGRLVRHEALARSRLLGG